MAVAYLALAWLLGVAAAAWADGDWWAVVAAAFVFGAASAAFRGVARRPSGTSLQRFAILITFGVSLVLLGGWRYAGDGEPNVSLAALNGTDVTMRAVISEEPSEGESGWVHRLDVREVRIAGEWVERPGKVLMTSGIAPAYEYGDLLELEGELREPPVFPDFNYRDYLLRQGVASTLAYPKTSLISHDEGSPVQSRLIDLRNALSDSLSDVLPEPHASLAAGIIFGSKSQIPDSLRDDMRITGTSHLVAVSGQNVTIVAALLIAMLAWAIGRRPAALFSLFAIAGYAVLVGGSPSVVRAAAMGVVYVVAMVNGRQSTGWVALALVAAIMTAANPRVIADPSFQLSFAATLGLTTLAGPLREHLEALLGRWPALADFPLTRPVSELAAVTVCAIVFTLPVTALTFGQISLVAPVANLFVVPAFLAVAATSSVAAVLGLAGLDTPATYIAYPAAEYMVRSVQLFARVPSADVHPPLSVAIAWYAVLLAGTWWLMHARIARPDPPKRTVIRHRRLLPAGGMALLIVMGAALAALWVSRPEDGRLSLTVMDVGQGDAILIEGPRGSRILIDGGPTAGAINEALGRNLPFDDRRIDIVALSHANSDHLGGALEVLGEYDVGAILDTARGGDSSLYEAWRSTLASSGLPVTTADRGQTIDLGDGARLEVLAPDADDVLLPVYDLNEASLVLRLTMGDVSFLLPGDLDENGEQALIRSGADLSADVLKVGHHGSRSSTSPAFVAAVDPLIDVISVGASNRFGHPAEDVLSRLTGDLVLRTDEHGDVRIETDGESVWVD